MLKGAIFDMDGLMFDSEKLWQKNWNGIAAEMGITLPDDFKYHITGTSGAIMNAVIEKYYHVEDGSDIAKECRQRVHDDLAEHVPEKTGIHEIVEMFSRNGVKLAVASSSPIDMIRRNLTKTDLIGYFDVLVTGQGLEHGKPAPDIFLKAAEELGLDPADCYVFEDAFNGVTAGYAAGCRTIMIPDLQPPTEEIRKQAAGVYENLLAAKEAIENGEI